MTKLARAVRVLTVLVGCTSFLLVALLPLGAGAQTPPAEPLPIQPPVPPSGTGPLAPEQQPAPPAVIVPPPPPPAPPPPDAVQANFGMRVGARLQSLTEPDKINHLGLDTIYVEPRFTAKVLENVSFQANFNAAVSYGNLAPAASVGIMDLVARFDFHDLFHVWGGRLLVPSDRSNFSGPFFMSPWNYPGFYVAGAPLGPKTGATGRDNGAVIWGDAGGGKFKYFVGAFGLDQPGKPYFSGRLNLALIGEEPGFYHSSTYYGDKNVLALGTAVQIQQDGSVESDLTTKKTTVLGMADLLAEFKVGDGVITGEAQYYKFNDGYTFTTVGSMNTPWYAPKQGFYVLGSYLTPPVGPGKIQPLVRVQRTIDPGWTILDIFVTYVLKGYDARIALGYQRTDLGGNITPGNAIQLGVQLQK